MIDSNNINVMREKLRKVSGGGSGVQEEIERIDNLIGASPIPGAQRTITGSLNYLYDNLGGNVKTKEYVGTGTPTNVIEFEDTPSCILGIKHNKINGQHQTEGLPMVYGLPIYVGCISGALLFNNATYDNNKLTLTGTDSGTCMNYANDEYTVYYI